MDVTGQPKDPGEALLAGRPLMFTGEDEEGGCLSLGHPSNIVLLVQDGDEYDEAQLAVGPLAAAVKGRWNLHHDLVAVVAALLPLAEPRVKYLRSSAEAMGEFAKGANTTPPGSVDTLAEERRAAAVAAEAVLGRAREVLKEAGHAL